MSTDSRSPAPRRTAGLWPWVVPALLVGQVGFSSVTVYLAVSDPSFAAEPDYYRKALDWDAAAVQRQAQSELGWRLDVDLASIESPLQERQIRVRLLDRDGRPIEGATVSAEAFHHARAAERFRLTFDADGEGGYVAPLAVRRTGLWELRLRTEAGGHTFVATQVLDIGPAVGVQP